MSTASPLSDWVAAQLAQGQSMEQVYLTLLQQGHTVGSIEAAVHEARNEQRAGDLQRRVTRIVLVVGAILIGAGVFSFIAANWREMVAPARIALIVFGVLLFSGSGYVVRERTENRLTGEALLLIGSVIFGAGIFLVAQIYNVQGNWPDGFMMWMLGTLAMAVAMQSTGLYVLALLVGVVASVGYPIGLLAGGEFDPYLLSSPLLALAGCAGAMAAGAWLRRDIAVGPEDRW